MVTQPVEQRKPHDKSEANVDQTVEDTFPASDAPSTGGTTKIGSASDTETHGGQNNGDVPGADPDEDVPEEDTPAEPSPGDEPPDEEAPQGRPSK